jgi:superfamily II DNA or RNA helicase
VPYNYHLIPIHLTDEEYEEYTDLSKEISRMSSYSGGKDGISASYSLKLTKRARIKKQASNKLLSLEALFIKLRKNNLHKNTLVYADSEKYLKSIQKILTEVHVKSTKFTGQESLSERIQAIENLRKHNIDAIIAIKCLDEGVDIPSATTGIFLANNTDPREYVQRLGRILRLDSVGMKTEAHVYDFLVLPPSDTQLDDIVGRNLVKNEFTRVEFFRELCLNRDKVDVDIGNVMDKYGYYFDFNKTEELNEAKENV